VTNIACATVVSYKCELIVQGTGLSEVLTELTGHGSPFIGR